MTSSDNDDVGVACITNLMRVEDEEFDLYDIAVLVFTSDSNTTSPKQFAYREYISDFPRELNLIEKLNAEFECFYSSYSLEKPVYTNKNLIYLTNIPTQ